MKKFRMGKGSACRTALKRAGNVVLSVVLALSFSGIFSAAAYASESDVIDGWTESIEKAQADKSIQTYSYAYSSDIQALSYDSDYTPSDKYDLRDKGVVTPVKFQNPWGTCWGFSIIAAAETSILSEEGKTYEATQFDLSELQLVKAVYNNNGALAKYVGEDQAGEGYHNSSADPNAGMNSGGFFAYGSSVFASGMGPLPESMAPYQNSEGIMTCYVTENGSTKEMYLTEEQAKEYEANGAEVNRYCWTGNYTNASGTTTYTTWDVDESLYNVAYYNLEDGNILPETRILDSEGNCTGTDMNAVTAIKEEIERYGRAVSIAFFADQSKPDEDGVCTYMNQNNWAQYTYKAETINHAVTIVGWDDTYSKTNFGDGVNNLPEGNGAWLVKNSWGAASNEFPNQGKNGGWGNDGYFWLSYYDKSISLIESYDFDTTSYNNTGQYYINQYDYLPEVGSVTNSSKNPISSANIFTAEGDLAVRTLSAATYKPNTVVDYEVYLLDDEATTPTDPDHSTLVYEATELYDYGGFHRISLDEKDWIAMREGQRFAVVTTQKCMDDGLYYQGVAVNKGKPTDEAVASYEAAIYESVQGQVYGLIYTVLYKQYKQEHPDWTEEKLKQEAEEMAADAIENNENVKNYIKSNVDPQVDSYKNAYFVTKVNAGESWTSVTWNVDSETQSSTTDIASVTNETEWSDWTNVKAEVEKKVTVGGQNLVADNAPIKAFSELREWASPEDLSELEQALASAKQTLANAKISADGSDVSSSDQWMTQADFDTLSEAVEQAEEYMTGAGENYATKLLNTTPSSDEVASSLASLNVQAKAGTATSGAAAQGGSSSTMAKTGDTTPVATCAVCAVASAVALASVLASRKKKLNK